MRTTISIDDDLYRDLKARAGATGHTVSELVEDAIRDALRTSREEAPIPDLPVFRGRLGLRPGVDLDDNAALRAIMDEPTSHDAHR